MLSTLHCHYQDCHHGEPPVTGHKASSDIDLSRGQNTLAWKSWGWSPKSSWQRRASSHKSLGSWFQRAVFEDGQGETLREELDSPACSP